MDVRRLVRRTAALLLLSYAPPCALAWHAPGPFVSRMDVYHHAALTPVLVFLCAKALLNMPKATQKDRLTATHWAGWQFYALYCCHAVVHSLLTLAKPDFGLGYKAAILVHHAVSLLAYASFVDGRGHFWGLSLGLCEVTGIFLNAIYLLDKGSRAAAANSLALWTSWVVFRLALIPAWLALWWHDSAVTRSEPRDTLFGRTNWTHPVAAAVLLALSAFWFRSIHRGFLRTFF